MMILWYVCMALFVYFMLNQESPAEVSKKAAESQAKAQADSFLRYSKFLSETTQAEKEIALQELAYADMTDDEIFFLATHDTN